MAQYVTTVAVGKWNDRANLDYAPVNSKVNGVLYNAFGVRITSAGGTADTRRPYRMEESGNTTYVMYDDDAKGGVPIFKVEVL